VSVTEPTVISHVSLSPTDTVDDICNARVWAPADRCRNRRETFYLVWFKCTGGGSCDSGDVDVPAVVTVFTTCVTTQRRLDGVCLRGSVSKLEHIVVDRERVKSRTHWRWQWKCVTNRALCGWQGTCLK